jgi:hypothetical protein
VIYKIDSFHSFFGGKFLFLKETNEARPLEPSVKLTIRFEYFGAFGSNFGPKIDHLGGLLAGNQGF